MDLEKQLFEMQDDYREMKNHLTSLENESDALESQLKIVLDQKEEDYVFYKKHIAEISKYGVFVIYIIHFWFSINHNNKKKYFNNIS